MRRLPSVWLCLLALGCGDAPLDTSSDAGIDTASTTIKVRQTPSAVRCLRVLVTNGTTLTRDFALASGQTTTSLDLGRLPAGPTTFDAEAFNVACSAITSSTSPEWVGEPVFYVLAPGQNPPIALVLVPNVTTTATVDFSTPPRQVVAGFAHTYGVLANGTVRAWGRRAHGALGDSATDGALRNTPVASSALSGVALLRASKHHETQCVINSAGALRCWGVNGGGELGEVATRPTPPSAAMANNIADVALGNGFLCAVERPDAATGAAGVSCVGHNASCQLGNTSVPSSATFVPVADIANARTVVAGGSFACALTSDGYVRCWGGNWNGVTGASPTQSMVCTPTTLLSLPDVVQIAAGHTHVCALRADGSVWCWGSIGSSTYSAPQRVQGVTDALEISTSWFATCARTSRGEVLCWGSGPTGTGNGGSGTPAFVRGLEDATSLSGGSAHMCATTNASGLVCWGANESGQLGDGTFDRRPVPARVTW